MTDAVFFVQNPSWAFCSCFVYFTINHATITIYAVHNWQNFVKFKHEFEYLSINNQFTVYENYEHNWLDHSANIWEWKCMIA